MRSTSGQQRAVPSSLILKGPGWLTGFGAERRTANGMECKMGVPFIGADPGMRQAGCTVRVMAEAISVAPTPGVF